MRSLTLGRSSRTVRKNHSRIESLENRRLLAAHIVGSSTVYSTIQAAVDAALSGAVINVDAGSYKESVVIGKSLTIQGAQAGVDARTNTRLNGATASESTVTGAGSGSAIGAAFKVIANDVTIDGFTVQGTTSANTTGGIVLGADIAGTHILNNIVQNNVSGMVLSNNSTTDPAIIQHNVFRNNNNAGANGGRGIYTDDSFFGSKLTNVTIDGNSFQRNQGSNGTTGFEAAIAIETFTAGITSNLRITNNTFDNNGKATLFFHTSNVTISGNVITNTQDQWSGTLRFEGDDHNVTITNNTLYDNSGPAVAIDSKGVPGDDSGFVINNNNFYGNSYAWSDKIAVIVNDNNYTGTLDARNNYWGSASGPSGNGSGTGDAVWGNGHVVSGAEWVTQSGGALTFSPFSANPIGSLDTPYWGIPSLAGPKIQAEEYDQGGLNKAYFTTGSNTAGFYRDAEGINIEQTTDSGGGYDVAKSKATDWLDYVVNVATAGTYEIDFRVANGQSTAGTFHVNIDGVNATGAISIPATGGWQTWTTLAKTGINITAGVHTLRIAYDTNGSSGVSGSMNYFQLINTSVAPVPAAPTNLVANAISTSQINLSWTNNATNQTAYEVDRSTDGVNFAPLTTTLAATATTYNDTTVAASTSYYYRVEATNAAGPSSSSNIASAVTPGVPSTSVNLSSLTWVSATTGYGSIQKNLAVNGNPLKIRGTTYATGIGTHAVSQIVYNLAGQYVGFVSDVGVDDEVSGNGAVDFQVLGDGKLLFDSGIVTGTSPVVHISVNVTGVQTLTLIATNGVNGSIDYDHADWAGAQLLVPSNSPPTAPSTLVATPISSSQINLTWANTSPSQTSVKIQRSTDGVNFSDLVTLAGNATSYSNTGLTASTTYTYRVFGINSNGTSPASNLAAGTTLAAGSITTNLSTLNWTSATVGWGTIQKNLSIKGNPLKLRGTTYATGIGTHADSTITYNLAAKYSTFQSDIGIDDEVNGQGSVVFKIVGDGVTLYTSPTITGASAVQHVSVSVAGVQNLQLIVQTTIPGNIDFDHGDWAGGAKLLS